LNIKYLGGPDVVKAVDQVEALQRGMIDMVFIASAYYTNVLSEIDTLKQSDYTPSEERANGAWAYLNNLHEKRLEIHYLARLGLGTKHQLYLKKPISNANLKGISIRVSPVHIQVVKGLGGNPVVIAIPEVYVALERNVVDGFCFPSVGIRDYGWQKQVKYIVDPPFYTVPNPLLVNLKVWNGMPQNMRDLLTEAGIEAEKRVVAMFDDLAKAERSMLLKEGMEVIDLPAAEKERFLRVAFEEGWKDILQKNPQTGPELKRMLTKVR
jgi:TRAP-type transport system periplasmic protein